MYKPFYAIQAYIHTDSAGEWWEYVIKDGRLNSIMAEDRRTKEFKTKEQAQKFAERKGFKKFKIIYFEPPIRPSRSWRQTLVYKNYEDDSATNS